MVRVGVGWVQREGALGLDERLLQLTRVEQRRRQVVAGARVAFVNAERMAELNDRLVVLLRLREIDSVAVVRVDKEPSGFCVVWGHRKRHAKLGDRIGPAGQAGICVSHDASRPRRLFAHRVLRHEHLELANRLVIAFQVEQRDAEVISRAYIGAGAGAKERQRIFVAPQA